eukprot:scaffold22573_cov79-Isochrysis_galbana.AAC.1
MEHTHRSGTATNNGTHTGPVPQPRIEHTQVQEKSRQSSHTAARTPSCFGRMATPPLPSPSSF